MKNPFDIMLFGVCALASVANAATVKVPLKEGWRFLKADDPSAGASLTMKTMSDVLDRADRGDISGAPVFEWAQPGFDDSAWRVGRVPHDWGVEKPFDSGRAYGDAFLDVTGVGWYRMKFRVESGELRVVSGELRFEGSDVGCRPSNVAIPPNGSVFFECDGAMSYAMLYLDGKFLGGWPYGYTRWRVDLTEELKKGTGKREWGTGEHVIAIRCHNVKDSSRWYTGGGLFRECRLLVCPEDYVVPGSVFITTPEVTAKRATVRVRYEMSKSGRKERTFTVENPRLWDIDDPYLYSVDVEGDKYCYGIRTISFHSDKRRFMLNGRTVPLNGVSMHHDFGVLGAAWNRTAQRRRLLLFKDAGVNAIRSSHNPPDEGLLELCDEIGLLVKDEVFDEWGKIGMAGKRKNGYTNLFETWHERDVRAWVRTDRNHPCVIMYSVGNEIPEGFRRIAPYEKFAKKQALKLRRKSWNIAELLRLLIQRILTHTPSLCMFSGPANSAVSLRQTAPRANSSGCLFQSLRSCPTGRPTKSFTTFLPRTIPFSRSSAFTKIMY